MSRPAKFFGVLVVALALSAYGQAPFLSAVANILIVEDSLRPAVAIVPLGGQLPFREIEAAKFYHAGFAPVIVIVPVAATLESTALQRLGINKVPEWELSRQVLIQQGVPESAILISEEEGIGTLEELKAAWEVVDAGERKGLGVRRNAVNAMNALPVILVTSKYHTRRTRLTWNYVTGGRSQAIVRAARGDPFDPDHWWHTRSYAFSVVREYLGLANYYAGFPVAP
jgi:uncharacterized SAM-binding protein YcdF (DUF218 family)